MSERGSRVLRPAVLVIDNYDSFTFNLVQLLASLARAAGAPEDCVAVVRNDASDAAGLLARAPGGVLLSPGPGLPSGAGVCLELVRRAPDDLPLFGVCLGMQILAEERGARVERARSIMHGRTSIVRHDGRGCFEALPEAVRVMRYHSWAVAEDTLAPDLEPSAWADDGTLMGMRERTRPREAVQFHPESFLTEHGARMLESFVGRALARV